MLYRLFSRCVLTLTLLTGAATALGQTQTAPLRFVVPYPAGGAADQITRLVANDVSSLLKRPIVIENKGGAAGMIAAETVLQAAADGNTFYVGSNAPIIINQAIYAKMSYDPAKDFTPVAGMAKAPLLLLTRPDLGVKDVTALIAYGKQEDGRLTMGSASSGNITHLAGVYAANKMGFNVTHVPFAGSAPAIISLIGSNIDIMFDALPSSMQQALAGRLVPLAILDNQRFPQLPHIPTLAELGYPGLEAAAWFGVFARTGVPQPAIDTLGAAITTALANPALVEKLQRIGAQPIPGSPQQFTQFIDAERAQWVPLAKSLHVQAD